MADPAPGKVAIDPGEDRPPLTAYDLWDGGAGTDDWQMICLTTHADHDVAALVDPRYPELTRLIMAAPSLLGIVQALRPVVQRVVDAGPCIHVAAPLHGRSSAANWLAHVRNALEIVSGEREP